MLPRPHAENAIRAGRRDDIHVTGSVHVAEHDQELVTLADIAQLGVLGHRFDVLHSVMQRRGG